MTDLRKGEMGRDDMLGALCFASSVPEEGEVQKGQATFTENEVLGNSYGIMVAGHDSTAHVIAFTLQLLCLFPEEQRKLHEQIDKNMPLGEPAVSLKIFFTVTIADDLAISSELRQVPVARESDSCAGLDLILTILLLTDSSCCLFHGSDEINATNHCRTKVCNREHVDSTITQT